MLCVCVGGRRWVIFWPDPTLPRLPVTPCMPPVLGIDITQNFLVIVSMRK